MHEKVEKLKKQAECWETDMGQWFPGERVVFRGKDLLSELTGCGLLELIFYSVSGRQLDGNVIEFIDRAHGICTSFPDPRLWNNRVAAIAATTRTTPSLAISASTAVSEASAYGRGADMKSSDFIRKAVIRFANGDPVSEIVEQQIKKYRVLPGFGRPITKRDERIEPIMSLASELGVTFGKHVEMVFSIQRYLEEARMRMNMNISGLFTAMMADIGITAKEFNLFYALSFSAGITACYVDAVDKPEGAFFPFCTDRVNYTGQENREW